MPWTVVAFQKSRLQTWRAIRPWLAVLVCGFIGFEIPFWLNDEHADLDSGGFGSAQVFLAAQDESPWEFALGLASLIVSGASVVAMTIAVKRHYRCPRCAAIPLAPWLTPGHSARGEGMGIALNPSCCPNCRARFR